MTPEQYHDGNEFFAHAQADRFWCVPASLEQQGEAAAAIHNPCVAQSNTATAATSGSSWWCCCCKSALSRCLSGLHVTCSVCQQQSMCCPRCLSCYEPIPVQMAVGPAQHHAEQKPAEVLTGRSRLLRSTPCMLPCILCWSSSPCWRQLHSSDNFCSRGYPYGEAMMSPAYSLCQPPKTRLHQGPDALTASGPCRHRVTDCLLQGGHARGTARGQARHRQEGGAGACQQRAQQLQHCPASFDAPCCTAKEVSHCYRAFEIGTS